VWSAGRFDGSSRRVHEEPPLAALEDGPVWVIDAFHGHRAFIARHGSLVSQDDGVEGLVLYDDAAVLAVIPAREILSYESVTVLDPGVELPYGRLWAGLEVGDRVVLVHADTGVRH
jgi:hypothetical protein